MLITLSDGEHEVSAPSTYGAELLRQWIDDPVGMLAIGVAVLLTCSEPMTSRFRPAKVWYPGEVAELLPQDEASRDALSGVVWDLLFESGSVSEEEGEADPTSPGSGSQ